MPPLPVSDAVLDAGSTDPLPHPSIESRALRYGRTKNIVVMGLTSVIDVIIIVRGVNVEADAAKLTKLIPIIASIGPIEATSGATASNVPF